MKKFLIRWLFFTPIPLLVIATNYFVDHGNIFHNDYNVGIVDYLLQGYNVTNIANSDERSLLKLYIEKMPECPEEIILGSSRIMLIGRTIAGNDQLINNGVSGASLEDLMAIYYLYEKKGCDNIHKVLIGLDPWTLNDNHGDTRWKSLANEYNAFLNILLKQDQIEEPIWNNFQSYYKYNELFSVSYFKSSLAYFIKTKKRLRYEPTKEEINNGMTKHIDGSISYDVHYRNLSSKEIDKKIQAALNGKPIYHMGNFTSLKKDYCSLFSNFIEYLQQKNIEVEFFLAPVHPKVYDYFQKDDYCKIVLDVENWYVNYARNHQIKVYGSFDPEKGYLDESYFYDGFHPKETAIKKILQ